MVETLQKASTGKLIPLTVDVTDLESIESASRFTGEITGGKLDGFMNNAGVGSSGGSLELTSMDVIRHIIETNLLGFD